MLTTRGRRSGKPRTTPLIYPRLGDDLIVAASNAGNADDPQWRRNLQADPQAVVQIGTTRVAIIATELDGRSRDEIWAQYLEMYAPLTEYQSATSRRIPLVALRNADAARGGEKAAIAGSTRSAH